jgi:hypothetical protein
MGTGKSTVAAVLFGGLATGGATLAHAQAPISGLAAQADARIQAEAAVASRILDGMSVVLTGWSALTLARMS